MPKGAHFESCSAPICLAMDCNNKETVWYTDEEICKGHAMDKLHRSIRTVQRGYQKRDKDKNKQRYFMYQQLKESALKNMEKGRRIALRQKKHPFKPSSRKHNPKHD